MTFENPVLLKEMRVRMRGGRAYWLMAGYVATLCLFFFIMYASVQRWNVAVNNSVNPRFAQELGRSYFIAMSIVQVVLGLLIAPALTSGALTIEREQRTFDLLAISLVRPRSIVFGKLVSALSYIALLTFASAPLVSVCFMLGGVDIREFAAAYTFILGNAFFFGIVGLFCSSLCQRTMAATMLAYSIAGFLVAGTFLSRVLVDIWGSNFAGISEFLMLFNPIAAVLDLCYDTGRWGAPSLRALWGLSLWGMTLVLYAVLAVPMLWMTVRQAKPWSVGEGAPSKTSTTTRTFSAKPPPTRDWSLPFDISNPVLKRELLSRLRSRRPLVQRWALGGFFSLLFGGVYIYLIYLMFAHTTTPQGWAGWWTGLSFCQLLLISIIAPALTASVLTVEREQRTLEMLLITRLTAWQVCWGKLWGRLASIVMLLLAFLPVMLLSAVLGGVNPIAFVGTYSILMATSLALGVLGLACSAFFRRTVTALAVAMVVTVGILMFLPTVIALLLSIFGYYYSIWSGDVYETLLSALHPYFALGMLSGTIMGLGNPREMLYYVVWLFCCGLFTGAAFLLLRLVCARFERLCRM